MAIKIHLVPPQAEACLSQELQTPLQFESHVTVQEVCEKAASVFQVEAERIEIRPCGNGAQPLERNSQLGSSNCIDYEALIMPDAAEREFVKQMLHRGPHGSYADLKHSRSLSKSRISLQEIPERAFEVLTQLEIVDLSKVELKALPQSLGLLLQLRLLRVRSNHLQALPPTIVNLTRLQNLDVCHNQVISLPPKFGELCSLEYLYLNHNLLSNFPATFGELPALKHLEASDNLLDCLPANFARLASLRHLELPRNRLIMLPGTFGQMVALRHLDVSENKLAALPGSLGAISRLESLNLSRNQLARLPDLSGLASLQFLDLSDNQMSLGVEAFEGLPALKDLRLTLGERHRQGSKPAMKVKLKFKLDLLLFIARRRLRCGGCFGESRSSS